MKRRSSLLLPLSTHKLSMLPTLTSLLQALSGEQLTRIGQLMHLPRPLNLLGPLLLVSTLFVIVIFFYLFGL
jgi:hypothetical protein